MAVLRRVTFECLDTELFDAVRIMGDGGAACGERLVGILLGGRDAMLEIGLDVYGIHVGEIIDEAR